MTRRLFSVAVVISALGSPLYAASAPQSAISNPQVELAITFALVTDPDLKISRVIPRLVSVDHLIASHRPWGEARLEHLDLQVVSGEDATRLLAALAKGQRLAKATTDIVPSGGQENVVHYQQVGMLNLNQKTTVLQNGPAANAPTSSPQPVMEALRFLLRPTVNSDGTVSLSFAPSHLNMGPILTPRMMSAASVVSPEELEDQDDSFTELGTIDSGGTVAITGLLNGPHLNGVEVIVFVTPTVL